MEYKKKCNVCGKIFCYTDEDLKRNLGNASLSALGSIGSLASTLGGGTIFHTQYLTNEANRYSDKIVDYNHCPYCNSTDLVPYYGEERQTESTASVASVPSPKAVNINSSASTETLLKRVFLFLEDGDWDSAEAYCEACLDKNPELAEAYLGKLMVEKKIHTFAEFSSTKENISGSKNYQRAIRYGSEDFVKQLQGMVRESEEKNLAQLTAIRERLNDPDCSVMIAEDSSIFSGYVVAVCADGSVQSSYNRDGAFNAEEWNNLVYVGIGSQNTIGLRSDGTVVACGKSADLNNNLSKWKDVKEIRIVDRVVVGLRLDGTVVAFENCAYEPEKRKWDAMIRAVSKWNDIISIEVSDDIVIGLCSDGTVKYCDEDAHNYSSIVNLRNVTKIKVLDDGVVAFYQNGNVDLVCEEKTVHLKNVKDVGGSLQGVCLKCDGTAFAYGNDASDSEYHVDDWKDIISIDVRLAAIGLTRNGSVVVTGNDESECTTLDWQDIAAIKTDSYFAVGICSDGTVLCCGEWLDTKVDTSGLKLFHDLSDLDANIARNKAGRIAMEKAAEERRIAEEKATEEKRKARVSELQKEKKELETELSSIKGAFASFKRKKLEAQILSIDTELKKLDT